MTLKDMRIAAKLTQQAVALELETTQGAVWQWESGISCPQLKKMLKLAELYGVTTDDIINAISTAKENSS